MTAIRPYCSFKVAGLLLGIDVLDIQEVIRHQEPTRVPTAPAFIQGLINLRGQIVTVLDLRKRLGIGPGLLLDQPMDVVVRTSGGAIGLVVDEVCDVFEIDKSALERPPETIPETIRRRISGLYPLADRSLLVLDIGKVLDG
jgi:purine-binding chemotaxis protein CheW